MMARSLRRTLAAVRCWGFTIMIVPKRGAIRRLCIPWLGVIGVFLLASYFFFSMVYLPLQQKDLVQLRRMNNRLMKENARVRPALRRADRLEDLINNYRETVDSINDIYESIRRKAPPSSSRLSSRSGSYHGQRYHLPEPIIAPGDGKVSLLRTLEASTVSLRAELEERQEQASALCEKLQAYEVELDHTPSIWPVRGSRITSRFGIRVDPFTKRNKMHDGVDLAIRSGSPVRAAADGTVIYAGHLGGYGYAVKIKHGYGYETLYGHNSVLLVSAGQNVKKGQLIARVGSTGRSTSPHLHYEVRLYGHKINPLGYCWR